MHNMSRPQLKQPIYILPIIGIHSFMCLIIKRNLATIHRSVKQFVERKKCIQSDSLNIDPILDCLIYFSCINEDFVTLNDFLPFHFIQNVHCLVTSNLFPINELRYHTTASRVYPRWRFGLYIWCATDWRFQSFLKVIWWLSIKSNVRPNSHLIYSNRNYTKSEVSLSEAVMLYWSNFVANG